MDSVWSQLASQYGLKAHIVKTCVQSWGIITIWELQNQSEVQWVKKLLVDYFSQLLNQLLLKTLQLCKWAFIFWWFYQLLYCWWKTMKLLRKHGVCYFFASSHLDSNGSIRFNAAGPTINVWLWVRTQLQAVFFQAFGSLPKWGFNRWQWCIFMQVINCLLRSD